MTPASPQTLSISTAIGADATIAAGGTPALRADRYA